MTVEVTKRHEFEPLGLSVEWPPLDYRRDDSTLYENINISTIIDVPPPASGIDSDPTPAILTSSYALAIEGGSGGWGTGTWPAANRAYVVPFHLAEPYTVKKLGWLNGATVSGNVDIGIYNSALTKLVSAGSTAQATISVVQEVDVADTTLPAGNYYMAMVMDNTTGVVFRSVPVANVAAVVGVCIMAAAFPLPTTFVLARTTGSFIPFIAVSSRTLLA